MIFDHTVLLEHSDALITGAKTTIWILVYSLFFGTLIAAITCAGNMQSNRFIRIPTRIYTHIFRTVPEMALIFWIYLCLPLILGLRMSSFSSGVIAISLIAGAFLGETLRAGILAVPKGQTEAAKALGLGFFARWYKVILPQAIRTVLPTLVSFMTELVKMTSLLAAISVGEMAYQANVLAGQTFKYNEFFTSIAIVYFVIIFPITVLSRRLEKKGHA